MKIHQWLVEKAKLEGKKLSLALTACEESLTESVAELRALAEDTEEFRFAFPQTQLRLAIKKALDEDPGQEKQEQSAEEEIDEKGKAAKAGLVDERGNDERYAGKLPEGKRYAYFASHKKHHTRFGEASADLARACKDIIKLTAGLEGYFDVDNLRQINKDKISEGIVQSCSLLLYLNEETLDSVRTHISKFRHDRCRCKQLVNYKDWCLFECEEARRHNLPIIVVVDTDKQTASSVINHYMEKELDWLFAEQIISYSSQGRDHAINLIIGAVTSAIEHCQTHDTLQAQSNNITDRKETGRPPIHNAVEEVSDAERALKKAILAKHGSAVAAFKVLSNADGIITKKEWRKLIKRVLSAEFNGNEIKVLRKKLPQRVTLGEFCNFVDSSSVVTAKRKAKKNSDKDAPLAKLPSEVPVLPNSFRQRPHAQQLLTTALLDSSGVRSTALTAPKSRISSQGMGGVGKTMLTAAVVRTDTIRLHFQVVCWLNLSQQPNIHKLQQRLFTQLTDGGNMPDRATKTVEQQFDELQKASKGVAALIVLDDLWDPRHSVSFDCIDAMKTASKLLITTRIKGVTNGVEVELELLGLQESVELLSTVAELNENQISPVCLEVAQLCGRLPLCLNIVGNLIRTYRGAEWEEEIPSILKSDLSSLAGESNATSIGMNLQQRVIQTGLDSITGDDAEHIASLFKGMAVFAEDQVVPVAIVAVLWASFGIRKQSVLVIRRWLSELLSRSILLGSVADGIAMHDIVRDFCLKSFTAEQLSSRQRFFTNSLLEEYNNVLKQTSKSAKTVVEYAIGSLTYHLKGAIKAGSLEKDDLAKAVLVHTSDDVVFQMFAAASTSDISKFAEWLAAEGHFFDAAKIFLHCVRKGQGSTPVVQAQLVRLGLAAIDQVETQGIGKVDVQFSLHQMATRYSDREDEKGASADWCLSLAADEGRKQQMEPYTQSRVDNAAAYTLCGLLNNKYCLNPSAAQLQRGAQCFLSYALACSSRCPGTTGFSRYSLQHSCLSTYTHFSICYLLPAELNEAKTSLALLGAGGSIFEDFSNSWSLKLYHRCVSYAGGLDFLIDLGLGIQSVTRFASMAQAQTLSQGYEAAITQVVHLGETVAIDPQMMSAWPVLSQHWLIMFQRVCSLHACKWNTIAAVVGGKQTFVWAWTREEGEIIVEFMLRDNLIAHGCLLLMATKPGDVDEAEATDTLPSPGCRELKDKGPEMHGTSISPHVFAADVARNMGHMHLALEYVNAALVCHRHPVKQQISYARLSGLLLLKS